LVSTGSNDLVSARLQKSSQADRKTLEDGMALRNCLAHGNVTELDVLRRRGVSDTVSGCRRALPALNRTAKAMDRVVWDRLSQVTGSDPWSADV